MLDLLCYADKNSYHSLDISNYTEEQIKAADIDGDGAVTILFTK